MKTLINKNNPQIIISAPEIERRKAMFYQDEHYCLIIKGLPWLDADDWTLVEEDSQLPANLDEAAKDAQEDLYSGFYSGHIAAYQEAFKRGAKWMAEQIKGGSK